MRIDKLNIENFRCFTSYEVSFAKNATVLIGKNGAGKTNLLTAIIRGLGFMFGRDNRFSANLGTEINKGMKGLPLWDNRYDDGLLRFIYPLKLEFEGKFNHAPLQWALIKLSEKGLAPTNYAIALTKVLEQFNDNSAPNNLPLLAYFSDSYPHKEKHPNNKLIENNFICRKEVSIFFIF